MKIKSLVRTLLKLKKNSEKDNRKDEREQIYNELGQWNHTYKDKT